MAEKAGKKTSEILAVSSNKDDDGKVRVQEVTISNEADIKPEFILPGGGPKKTKDGTTYSLVDGRKWRFDLKTSDFVQVLGLAFALLMAFAFSARAQGPTLGKFRTSLNIPAIDAPVCLKPKSGLVISCYSGTIYEGGAGVTAGSSGTYTTSGAETAVSLTATDSMGTCPTTGACNFIYSDSGGTLHITTTLATAWGTGNAPLYFVQTASGAVSQMEPVWRCTRPIFSLGLPTPVTDSGTQLVTTEPVVYPASTTTLASTNIPAGTAPTTPVAGDVWNDSTQKAVVISPIASDPLNLGGALTVLHAQTPITTVSTIQALNSTTVTVPANALNTAGKTIHVKGYFVWSNGVDTPVMTISLKLGSVTMAAPVSAALVASNSSSPAWFEFFATTVATGASGTLEAHGVLMIDSTDATAGNALSIYPDHLAAVSSAVDLTSAENITVNMTVSGGPVTTATLRLATFEILN